MYSTVLYFMLLCCLFITGTGWSQDYGGYASVYVKNSEGVQRCINVNEYCNSSTKSYAESKLLSALNSDRKYNEVFSSEVNYTFIKCDEKDTMDYGGSASAVVRDSEGKKRTINVNEYCNSSTYSYSTQKLLSSLNSDRKYNEVFISSVAYSITKCYDKDPQNYGGSASVSVVDDAGNSRFLNVSEYCNSSTVAYVKQKLLSSLNSDRKYNEKFTSPVKYSISSCD